VKIDLPITIIFDCQATDASSIGRAAGHVIGTLRYETDGDGSDAVLFGSYPPDEKPCLVGGREYVPEGEPALALLSHIPAKADARISSRAARSPWDYMVGTDAERQAAQDKVDAERDPTP
jgi:hypothetical protein